MTYLSVFILGLGIGMWIARAVCTHQKQTECAAISSLERKEAELALDEALEKVSEHGRADLDEHL